MDELGPVNCGAPSRPRWPRPLLLLRPTRCAHSLPPGAHVLGGYRPSGKPEWRTFVSACLERADPRLDRLFDERPTRVALVFTEAELTERLDPVPPPAPRVLGQLAFGLFEHPGGRTALLVLVLRLGDELRMELLGVSMDDLIEAAENGDGAAEAARRTLRSARQRLLAIAAQERDVRRRGAGSGSPHGRPENGEAVDYDPYAEATTREVEALLRQVGGELEHAYRSTERRTRHGQERHEGGERPTHRALADAMDAPAERHFRDPERETVVVVGRKQRAHVFNDDARLVTSFDLTTNELDRKLSRRRWEPLSGERYRAFRVALGRALRPE